MIMQSGKIHITVKCCGLCELEVYAIQFFLWEMVFSSVYNLNVILAAEVVDEVSSYQKQCPYP
jgi:hypothetical protein